MDETEETKKIKELLENREWRINNLYHILDKNNNIVRFKMNWAQEELHHKMHNRNTVLKARQLGISTYSAILMLDQSLFFPKHESGINDRSDDEAKEKLGKIKFAYEHLDYLTPHPSPRDIALSEIGKAIKQNTCPSANNAKKIIFANGSVIRVGTSLRGGTLNFLHVSELGGISIDNPRKAREIVTGSINSVPQHNSLTILESTHKGGKHGENYKITKAAMENHGKELSPLDFKFFFFPWWKNPEYAAKVISSTHISPELESYFAELRDQEGINLTQEQMAWYSSIERTNGLHMKQEYPSTPAEAFAMPIEGAIYGAAISNLRSKGRIGVAFEPNALAPIYCVFDIGTDDYTSMWLIQPVGNTYYMLNHYQASNLPVSHYINVAKGWEGRYGIKITLYILPHDAATRDVTLTTFEVYLKQAGIYNTKVLKRTPDVWIGINALRMTLPHCVFHADCNETMLVDGVEYISGIESIENYHTKEGGAIAHDIYSHSADSLRYFAEAKEEGIITNQLEGSRRLVLKSKIITGSRRC